MVNGKRILLALGVFLAVGFLFLSLSETSFAGAPTPGCCITNGGQCSPSCGPIGTSCQNPGDGPNPFSQCPDEFANPADCGADPFAPNQKCHVLGAVCFQVDNNAGICLAETPTPTPTPTATPSETPTPTPEVTGCCGLQPDDPFFCSEGLTPQQCADVQGTFNQFGSCQVDDSCEQPPPIPTMNEWGMIIMAGFLGLTGIFFGIRRFRASRIS